MNPVIAKYCVTEEPPLSYSQIFERKCVISSAAGHKYFLAKEKIH